VLPPKSTGALEHCHEGKTNCWFSISLVRVLLTASLRRRRRSMYVSLVTVANGVNYAGEVWQLFEAAAYVNFRAPFNFIERREITDFG
jgi:hypothetical protein